MQEQRQKSPGRRLPGKTVFGLPALAMLLGLAALPAHAQNAQPLAVTIDARAYAQLDPTSAITVEAANDTDQAQRLKADIITALEARGFRVEPNAAVVLQFYATEPQGGTPDRSSTQSENVAARPSPVGPTAGVATTAGANDQHFQTSLVSKITDSLFGTKEQSGAAAPPPPPGRAVHVNIDLNDRTAARRIWQGSAGTFTDRPDSYSVASTLVPALIERLGADATQERVDLP
jgi:hypothetical protein